MRDVTDLLSRYAAYHRDRRNILSHFLGVPLIVFAIGVLLGQPTLFWGELMVTPAWVACVAAITWYLTRGSVSLGLAVSALVTALILLAHQVAGGGFATWFWGLGVFVLGWAIQFIGHWYEGKKPAFVDDLVSLLVGPMFVTAEALFALGWNKPLRHEIERRVGPTTLRDMARIA